MKNRIATLAVVGALTLGAAPAASAQDFSSNVQNPQDLSSQAIATIEEIGGTAILSVGLPIWFIGCGLSSHFNQAPDSCSF